MHVDPAASAEPEVRRASPVTRTEQPVGAGPEVRRAGPVTRVEASANAEPEVGRAIPVAPHRASILIYHGEVSMTPASQVQ